jgi:signal transduction histidine kinase
LWLPGRIGPCLGVGLVHAEERLDQPVSRRAREAFHDMQQPVAAVLALSSAALAVPSLSVVARSYLEQIVEQAEWLAEIIDDGLRPRMATEKGAGRCDAAQVIGDAAAAHRLCWAGELNMLQPSKPVRLAIHPVVFRRLVTNLLDNATRAAGPTGTVTIEVAPRGEEAWLMVDDDGPGFGRIRHGLGLGLQEVARTAIEHDGRLESGPSPLGGARVAVCLPLVTGQQHRDRVDGADPRL